MLFIGSQSVAIRWSRLRLITEANCGMPNARSISMHKTILYCGKQSDKRLQRNYQKFDIGLCENVVFKLCIWQVISIIMTPR